MRKGRRFLLQLLLLPVLLGISFIDQNLYTGIVAVALVLGWPVSVAVALILVWLSRQLPDIESLIDMADNSVSMAMGMTALAAVGLAVIARITGVITGQISQYLLVGLGWAIVVFIVPSLTWFNALRNVWLPTLKRRQEAQKEQT